MRILYILLIPALILSTSCNMENKGSQGKNFDANVDRVLNNIVDESEQLQFFDNDIKSIPVKFTALPAGSNYPKGWLLDIMKTDLETGMVGALDDLYPGIKSDDLYNTARRGGMEDIPEMGDLVLTGAAWEKSIMWWNAETAGNWWDGYVRHAYQTGNTEAIFASKAIIKNLLDSQDEDGYIGIYKDNLRYQHEGSNGELWAQTTAFRTMLAYYEFTGENEVLQAVEKGMQLTMKEYGEDGRNPFYLKNAFGGVTHGLMLTDVCETLFRITGKKEYQDYALYLYRAFSTYSINRSFNDMRYTFLIEKDSLFTGHAVHTYEHLRTIINAYYHSGFPELKTAYENALHKLDHCLLPSGAGHGNEWIKGMHADPTITSTEFCTMVELRNFFTSAFQKSGSVAFADKAEKLTYNGIMGFRNDSGTALTYGKGDNCYRLDGKHYENGHASDDPRYKYSPTHSEPAVCCVPNYGRNFTYFLDNMWMKGEGGLYAMMYGPSEFTTQINDTEISILQLTNYPLIDEISFKVNVSKPASFALYFRKPGWTETMIVEGVQATDEGEFIKIEKEWNSGDKFDIHFVNKIQLNEFQEGEYYFQRGPLVYAHNIQHEEKIIKEYPDKRFKDYYCEPMDDDFEILNIAEGQGSSFQYHINSDKDLSNPWYNALPHLKGKLLGNKGKELDVKLIPMGSTALRQVTFKVVE